MSLANEFAELFRRDLTRLIQQLEGLPNEEVLWKTVPGISNSIGNLAMHLEGNQREYIGRLLGRAAYERQRDQEFLGKGVLRADLIRRISEVRDLVPSVLDGLSDEQLDAPFPDTVLGRELTTRQFVVHLYGHFSYHLGQIDYLRRVLTGDSALKLATL